MLIKRYPFNPYLWDVGTKKQPKKTAQEIAKSLEEFMKGKEQDPDAKKKFDKLLKLATDKDRKEEH